MRKIKLFLCCLPLFTFMTSCEPEEISSDSSEEANTTSEYLSDTGEDGGPIDDKRDKD